MKAPLKLGGKGLELRPSIALQRKISMEDALEFNFPNVQYILYTPVGILVTLAAEENVYSKIKTSRHSEQERGHL